MPGMVDSGAISGNLAAADLVTQIMIYATEVSNYYTLCTPVSVPNLSGTIPIQTRGPMVLEDLEELEGSSIEGATFTSVKFNLPKDRFNVAISDEARYRSRAGNPLTLQIQSGGTEIAATLDQKAIRAFLTQPQTGPAKAPWDNPANNPYRDLATAVAAIKPYKADFVIMSADAWAYWVGNDVYKGMVQFGAPLMERATGYIPGLGLNLFVETGKNLPKSSVVVGASKSCAAYGKGPVEINSERNNNMGAEVYTMDVFRQIVAPLFTTEDGLNQAIYTITDVSG